MSRRADLVPVVLLAGLVGFVGFQAVSASPRAAAAGVGDAPTADVARGRSGRLSERHAGGSAEASGRRAAEWAVLEQRRAGTYIDALIGPDSMLLRWTRREDEPLRVWVQPSSSLRGWYPDQVGWARDAFRDWERVLALRFQFVDDSAAADVRVQWVSRLAGEQQIGNSSRSYDETGRIVHAEIQLAVLGRDGRALPERTARIAVLHEVGHVLGLEHSPDARDVMVARYDGQATGLSPADVATVHLLYALPTGRIGR